jgi:purine catabolism regulator
VATHPAQRDDKSVLVSDVFGLDALRGAGLEVVAGADGLDRAVTWVHAGEIADIATFLSGGELLLTAGTGIADDPDAQRAYIDRLAEAGASGLVLELGLGFAEVPAALVAAAEHRGLPMAVLHDQVAFAEVTRTVHGRIISLGNELRERAQHITEEFNSLLLAGGSVPQVVHKLYELTNKPAFLEDAAHQLVEYAGSDADIDAQIADWSAHSRSGHHTPPSGSRTPAPEEERASCAFASIGLRGETWGRLHLLRSGGPIDDIDRLAVERAGSAVGLALLNTAQDARLAERSRADFLAEAARRAPADPNAFLRQAQSLGADFRDCKLVAVSIITDDPAALSGEVARGAAACAEAGLSVLSSGDGAEGQLLIGVRPDDDPATTVSGVAEATWPPGSASLTVGLSRPADIAQLSRAFHEAQECLRFGRVSSAAGVVEYATLGLHLLLATLADRYELAEFLEAELGALLQHDATARSPLLPTLEALLTHGNNRTEAAAALHVERRSLYYRIGRIEKVLGKRLDDYDVRLGLGVALRALNVIEDRVRALPTSGTRGPGRGRR